jgi:hypothetical protein
MTGRALARRPTCRFHGTMELRDPPGGWTREQQWCGVWYDCADCLSSVLLPSPELLAASPTVALAEVRRGRRRKGGDAA